MWQVTRYEYPQPASAHLLAQEEAHPSPSGSWPGDPPHLLPPATRAGLWRQLHPSPSALSLKYRSCTQLEGSGCPHGRLSWAVWPCGQQGPQRGKSPERSPPLVPSGSLKPELCQPLGAGVRPERCPEAPQTAPTPQHEGRTESPQAPPWSLRAQAQHGLVSGSPM